MHFDDKIVHSFSILTLTFFYIHPPVTIISKNLHFKFIQLIMYMVFIIEHIHHLMNEFKMLTFAYNSK